jgi:hypothetical protein
MSTDPTEQFLKEIESVHRDIKLAGNAQMVETYKLVVNSINQILALYQIAGPEKMDPNEALSQIAQLTALLDSIENIDMGA